MINKKLSDFIDTSGFDFVPKLIAYRYRLIRRGEIRRAQYRGSKHIPLEKFI